MSEATVLALLLIEKRRRFVALQHTILGRWQCEGGVGGDFHLLYATIGCVKM
jgi:hypothetical protein